jgi:Reverse transcriptase (RNA-dependent DNA polymerase)
LLSDNGVTITSCHPMVTRAQDNTITPRLFPDYIAHHSYKEVEPRTFNQASIAEQWRSVMSLELTALADNKTWTLVPPSSNQKVIGCKRVYKIKRKANGKIKRYKARLVAKCYNQEAGVDYDQTYSLVVRATTIRVVLALVVSSNWSLKQLDVSNAFLNRDLHEQVFMEQPLGFIDSFMVSNRHLVPGLRN